MKKKITIVGGGSTMFVPGLLRMFMRSTALKGSTICLMDVDPRRVETMASLGRRLVQREGVDLTIESTTEQRAALVDADFVIVAIAVGGMAAWEQDIEIPGRYGVFTEVHDSIGPGGIMRAFRHVPILAAICQDLAEVSPSAWVFNYTNPAAANTMAMKTVPSIKSVSLCSCVGLPMNTLWLAALTGVPPEEIAMPPVVAGINHCAGIVGLHAKDGTDLLPRIRHRTVQDLLAGMQDLLSHSAGANMAQEAQAALGGDMEQMARRFVYSSGLGEAVVPWAIDTFGVMPYCWTHWIEFFPQLLRLAEPYQGRAQGLAMQYGTHIFDMNEKRQRVQKWQDLADRWSNPAYADEVSLAAMPTGEEDWGIEVVEVIEALIEHRRAVHIVNTTNGGAIPNLPAEAIVEVNAVVDGYGIRPVQVGPLAEAYAAPLRLHLTVQQLTTEAALRGDRKTALQALLLDPATAAVLEPPRIEQMLDEMLKANAPYLHRFA
jgi:alpha-galactosidase/6-phospho-beta-glucosidase family protein